MCLVGEVARSERRHSVKPLGEKGSFDPGDVVGKELS